MGVRVVIQTTTFFIIRRKYLFGTFIAMVIILFELSFL